MLCWLIWPSESVRMLHNSMCTQQLALPLPCIHWPKLAWVALVGYTMHGQKPGVCNTYTHMRYLKACNTHDVMSQCNDLVSRCTAQYTQYPAQQTQNSSSTMKAFMKLQKCEALNPQYTSETSTPLYKIPWSQKACLWP